MSDEFFYYLSPGHFSVLYVFTTDEGFSREDLGPYSEVYWDSANRNIYILSDRRDATGTDERIRSPAPFVYDQTTSFTVRATWKTTVQGNWQTAAPVFFAGGSNDRVDMANSVYVYYSSRDSNLGWSPYYYLRYRDGGGTLRVNHLVQGTANVQYEFLLGYDAYTRTMNLVMYDSDGLTVGSTTYILGTSEAFSLGKIGTAALGGSSTLEPRTYAVADNLLLDANAARNGNYEVDSNGDGVPDNWERWTWSKGPVYRSSDRAKYGIWSVKIADSDSTKDYGLQTTWMSASPGSSYIGTTWAYVSSGQDSMCLEFWDSYGSRLAVGCRSTATTGRWEYLDITMTAPSGTVGVDLLVYSSTANTGTAYFDGSELRRSRSFWSIHVHMNHVPDAATWRTVLDYVTDLGITTIRIDFSWWNFEPSKDAIDWGHVAYWDSVVRQARARGIGIVAILEHIPEWALTIRDCRGPPSDPICGEYGFGDLDAFFWQWYEFAMFVGGRYYQDVQYFQLLNEENHFAHTQFPHTHDGEPRAFDTAYRGLLGGSGLSAESHKSRFKTIVNAFADPGGDEFTTWMRDILNDAWGRGSIDVVAIDHYPGTWCCGSSYRDWAALDALSSIARDYGKEMGIMETGFTTYGLNPAPPFNQHYQADQEAFVDQAMDEVLTKKSYYNANYPSSQLVLVSWYEFIDTCSNCGGWPLAENHFGILTYVDGTWGMKLAYDNLRYQVSRWN